MLCPPKIYRANPVSRFNYFIDESDGNEELDKLLRMVGKGDAVVVGSIADFICDGNVSSMLNILEKLNDLGVILLSRLEPDYELSTYRPMIDLADRIAKVSADGKAI